MEKFIQRLTKTTFEEAQDGITLLLLLERNLQILKALSKHSQNQKENKQAISMKLLQVQSQHLSRVTKKLCKTILRSYSLKKKMILMLLPLKHRQQRFQKVLLQNLMLTMSHKRLKTVTNRVKNQLMMKMSKLNLLQKFKLLKVQQHSQYTKSPISSQPNQKYSNSSIQKQLSRKETLKS